MGRWRGSEKEGEMVLTKWFVWGICSDCHFDSRVHMLSSTQAEWPIRSLFAVSFHAILRETRA